MMKKKHKHLYNEQCPECKKLGKDNSKDNLAVYSNGKWCFSCGYHESVNGIVKFKDSLLLSYQPTPSHTNIHLPEDSCLDYPTRVLNWIGQYELSRTDLLNNNCIWSANFQRLIFPVYYGSNLIAWQGRYFGPEKKAKWFGIGNLKETYNILGVDNKLILCEDIISAIKLSKYTMAMPLYGCNIGCERYKGLYNLLSKDFDIRIWLDPDMRPRALKQARLGKQMGLNCSVIYSDKDPKEHTEKELLDKLNNTW